MTAKNKFGISGLAITTPVLGRISIGYREEIGGRILPKIDDSMTITTEKRNGLDWIEHPLQKILEDAKREDLQKTTPQKPDVYYPENAAESTIDIKLRSIPVTILYDRPELNISANYSAFDINTGRQMCVGDGEKAKRFVVSSNKTEDVSCNGPDYCEYAKTARCKLTARMLVKIDGQTDPHAGFIFRTTGYNSVRSLIFRLHMTAKKFGGLRGIPMSLVMRAKSTIRSMGRPVFFLDLCLRDGMTEVEAKKLANKLRQEESEAGLDQVEFESMIAEGLSNSHFVDIDEGAETVEEFFSDNFGEEDQSAHDLTLTEIQGNAEIGITKAAVATLEGYVKAKLGENKYDEEMAVMEAKNQPVDLDPTSLSKVDPMALSGINFPPNVDESRATRY